MVASCNCASTPNQVSSGARERMVELSKTKEQIDSVNYLIYLDYKKLEAAKGSGGDSQEISDLELRLHKLSDLRDYLRRQRISLTRKE